MRHFLLLLVCVSAAASPGAANAAVPMNAMDIFELEYAADPRISPDGTQIVYVRNSMDIMKDRGRRNLWLLTADGRKHRPLLSGPHNYSSPRWSPDGKRLAYLSDQDGSTQLYVRWMDTGQTALVTNLREGPNGLSWSPDGRWLSFVMHVAKKLKPLARPPEKPEGAKWAEPVNVIETVRYRSDGEGFLETGFDHVFVVPAEGGTARQLSSGDFDHRPPLSWTPDSRYIVLSANRADDWERNPVESEIHRLALADGALATLSARVGPDAQPAVSPDGRHIAYMGFDDRRQGYQVTQLHVMDADGGNARSLSKQLDRSVANPAWGGDGRIYFQYDDRGTRHIAFSDLNGEVRTVARNIGGTTLGRPYTSGGFTVARNGTVATVVTAPDHPADVASVAPRRDLQRLTRLNDDALGGRELARVEAITWSSPHDEREIQGWIAFPPGFDSSRQYPLLLEIHGGPFAAYGPNFSAEVQLYAAAGYVVLYTNPRGSTSYGEEFGNLIHHAYPGNDYDDLMSGVDAVIAQGYVDEEQLFITGGSGGGVLTAWTVGKTKRFRAAVVAKPVINWASFVLTSDGYPFFMQYWFPAMPWDDPQHYWERSPLSLVGNVETPTMLLTGEQDFRTPISESEQFYQALQMRGIDTALVRVPGASHGIAQRPSQLIAKVDNILAWFARYGGPATAED